MIKTYHCVKCKHIFAVFSGMQYFFVVVDVPKYIYTYPRGHNGKRRRFFLQWVPQMLLTVNLYWRMFSKRNCQRKWGTIPKHLLLCSRSKNW